MKFGIVDGTKTEAQPKLRGTCPFCGSDLVAKCGKVLVWHWSHKRTLNCDPWWENETAWHRAWKDRFPKDWQEIIHTDPLTGEKHIADVKTPDGLVIEFQHSPISPEEMASREAFYGKMIWIVDGSRNDADAANFNMGLDGEIQSNPIAYRLSWWSRSRLFHNWGKATQHVYMDFGKEILWRLVFFEALTKKGVVGPLYRQSMIEDCINGTSPFRILFRDPSAE